MYEIKTLFSSSEAKACTRQLEDNHDQGWQIHVLVR